MRLVGRNFQERLLVLEYCQHGSLRDYLQERRAEYEAVGVEAGRQLVHWAVQLAAALQHCANRGVIHRDIALRNVLLTGRLAVRLADFGLAVRVEQAQYWSRNTRATPFRWSAPESLAQVLRIDRFATNQRQKANGKRKFICSRLNVTFVRH